MLARGSYPYHVNVPLCQEPVQRIVAICYASMGWLVKMGYLAWSYYPCTLKVSATHLKIRAQFLIRRLIIRSSSWSLKAARLIVWIISSLWNLTGTSAALLPRCLPNFKLIVQLENKSCGFRTLWDLAIKRLTDIYMLLRYLQFSSPILQWAADNELRWLD